MKIGFLGFGEVSSILSEGLLDNGVNVFTCLQGRSSTTKNKALEMGVTICPSYRKLAEKSEILISAVTPSTAVEVARDIGKYSRGIYVDINNISPATVREALGQVENKKTVDAAIIGSVKRNGSNVQIIACGDSAQDFAFLNDYGLNIKIMGTEIGNCSQIKMLRSSYTKGVSALLWETISAAYKMGIDEEVMEIIGETEGQQFKNSVNSRLISSFKHAKRRYEEMDEVKNLLSDEIDPIMADAIENTFEIILDQNKDFNNNNNNNNKDFKDAIEFKSDLKSYKELFKHLYD
ncbi:MAG: DUF1932 domain-containing protein [Methanobacteriaceae archaeon]|nr:DUF1932 domain-containing protein [Methanobacteriaceae archaeon]MDP3035287.1 DUF1932 domain-containing protein [Methanobacteriaceae archaeon]